MIQYNEDRTNLANSLRFVLCTRSPNQCTVTIAQSHFHKGQTFEGRNKNDKPERKMGLTSDKFHIEEPKTADQHIPTTRVLLTQTREEKTKSPVPGDSLQVYIKENSL